MAKSRKNIGNFLYLFQELLNVKTSKTARNEQRKGLGEILAGDP